MSGKYYQDLHTLPFVANAFLYENKELVSGHDLLNEITFLNEVIALQAP